LVSGRGTIIRGGNVIVAGAFSFHVAVVVGASVLFCNFRTLVITFYSGHICDAFCINAWMFVTRKDPG
jgi:hypothetical protein